MPIVCASALPSGHTGATAPPVEGRAGAHKATRRSYTRLLAVLLLCAFLSHCGMAVNAPPASKRTRDAPESAGSDGDSDEDDADAHRGLEVEQRIDRVVAEHPPGRLLLRVRRVRLLLVLIGRKLMM